LATIREQALAALHADRHLAGLMPAPPDPSRWSPDLVAAYEGASAARSRLKRTLVESGATSPDGWLGPTVSTLRDLVRIYWGVWDTRSLDDFPDFEAEVEALGREVGPAGTVTPSEVAPRPATDPELARIAALQQTLRLLEGHPRKIKLVKFLHERPDRTATLEDVVRHLSIRGKRTPTARDYKTVRELVRRIRDWLGRYPGPLQVEFDEDSRKISLVEVGRKP
jgi:hypothetical protein